MIPCISYLFSLLSLFLVADALFLDGLCFLSLPFLTAPLSALCGFLVAAVWYLDINNRERAKKKRKKAMFAMVVSLSCCVCSLLFLLARMFL